MEEAFSASKGMCQMWGAFIGEVSNAYGAEVALDLLLSPWKRAGTAYATRMKNSAAIDLETIANQHVNSFVKRGFECRAEVTPTTITYTTNRCPLYEGFVEAGVSHETMRAFCTGVGHIYDDRLKALYHPNAAYTVTVRSTADDVCTEEITLKP
jgi:hypothetical protein